MSTIWPTFISQCKSRISAIARECFLSREHWKAKYTQQIDELQAQLNELESRCKQAEAATKRAEELWQEQALQTKALEQQLEQAQQSVHLPDDPPAPGQQFGPSFVALSVNLAREIGLRKAVEAMKVFFPWLNVKQRLPTYQTIRGWMFRLGLDRQEHAGRHDDWIWIADHSNQIGQQKCLLVLGIRQSKLPPVGTPLRRKDMKVLAVVPSEKCDRESVGNVYRQIANKYGIPRAVISDGAVELREPINRLKSKGKAAISIRDLKHFLANRLKQLLSKDKFYQEFLRELGKTRSSIQQTELSHLTPPVMRQKARFMNLSPFLDWANMTLWHLTHPTSQSREEITDERMQSKLGWLEKYREHLTKWTNYQTIMSTTLTFINNHGLQQGTSSELRNLLKPLATEATEALVKRIIKFIHQFEKKLYLNERLPMSSEIIESTFAKFKALEQNQGQGGFTQLVLAIACLFKAATAKEIKSAFARTKVRDTQEWLKNRLPTSHDARRQAAYREYRRESTSKGNKKCATPSATAA